METLIRRHVRSSRPFLDLETTKNPFNICITLTNYSDKIYFSSLYLLSFLTLSNFPRQTCKIGKRLWFGLMQTHTHSFFGGFSSVKQQTAKTHENTDKAVLGAVCVWLIKLASPVISKSGLNFMPCKPMTKSDPKADKNCLQNNQNSFKNILVYFLFSSWRDLVIMIIAVDNSSMSQVFSTHLHSIHVILQNI